MSTIIEAPWLSNALGAIAKVALVLGAWTLVLLAMPFVPPSGRTVAVVGEPRGAVRAIIGAGGRIVEARRGAILARGPAGFVPALYEHGARLVIEGRIGAGCFAKR